MLLVSIGAGPDGTDAGNGEASAAVARGLGARCRETGGSGACTDAGSRGGAITADEAGASLEADEGSETGRGSGTFGATTIAGSGLDAGGVSITCAEEFSSSMLCGRDGASILGRGGAELDSSV